MPRISKRREAYSHTIADRLKEERRVEGEIRNERWAGLTTEEKLESLVLRSGDSRKQVFRLTGQYMSAREALTLISTEDNDGIY